MCRQHTAARCPRPDPRCRAPRRWPANTEVICASDAGGGGRNLSQYRLAAPAAAHVWHAQCLDAGLQRRVLRFGCTQSRLRPGVLLDNALCSRWP